MSVKFYFFLSALFLLVAAALVVFANTLVTKSMIPTDYFILDLPTGENYFCVVKGHDMTCDWYEGNV